MAPRKPATGQRNGLTYVEQKALDALIIECYTASKMSDAEFAAMAAARLGFAVTQSNVTGMRTVLGVEANFKRQEPPRDGDMATVMALLEEQGKRIVSLEAELNTLLGRPQMSLNLATGEARRGH